jgi:hypothetical protein
MVSYKPLQKIEAILMTKSVLYVKVKKKKDSFEPQIIAGLSIAKEMRQDDSEVVIYKDIEETINEQQKSCLSDALTFLEENDVKSFIVYTPEIISKIEAEFKKIRQRIEEAGTKIHYAKKMDARRLEESGEQFGISLQVIQLFIAQFRIGG